MPVDFKRLVYALFGLMMGGLQLLSSASAEPNVGIIMPQLGPSFSGVYNAIESGINAGLNNKAYRLSIDKNYQRADIIKWIKQENLHAVITLGLLGESAARHIPDRIAAVSGGLLMPSKFASKYPRVVLTAHPGLLFKLLKQFDSAYEKVIIVYNPLKNQWLVDLAKRQAVESRVQLVVYQATNIKEAAIIYNEIFSRRDLHNTALWLLQDSKVVDTKAVLPFILDRAWRKKVIVFSNTLSHAKKGVLFSTYPNNRLHGEELAALALENEINHARHESKIYPTYGLQRAVNARTARHLGLRVTRSVLKEFDLVFPVSNQR